MSTNENSRLSSVEMKDVGRLLIKDIKKTVRTIAFKMKLKKERKKQWYNNIAFYHRLDRCYFREKTNILISFLYIYIIY